MIILESNIIATEHIETARYSNKEYFSREYFLYLDSSNFFAKHCSLSFFLTYPGHKGTAIV